VKCDIVIFLNVIYCYEG